MCKTIYIAHGFRSRKHVEWVENARSRFEAYGYAVQPVHYGFTTLLDVRLRTISNAARLAEVAHEPSIGIGHSNGCELLLRAANKGANFSHLVFINPALKEDIKIPDNVDHIDVFYSPTDKAVVFGALWRNINPINLFVSAEKESYWGKMGRVGYVGSDSRIKCHNLGPTGHSGALAWYRAPKLWQFIVNRIENPEANNAFEAF